MAYKNMVSVRVCGKTMTLSGNESVEYITEVANYIEDKAEDLRKSESSRNLSPNLVSVLTSINIADDYFKEITKNQSLLLELADAKKSIPAEPVVAKTVADNLRALLDGIKAEGSKLKDENQVLKEELEKITNEKNELDKKLKNSENTVNDLKHELKRKIAVIDQLTLLVQSRTSPSLEKKVVQDVEESKQDLEKKTATTDISTEIENQPEEVKSEEKTLVKEIPNSAENAAQGEMRKPENQKQISKKDSKKHHKHPHKR